MSEVFVKANYKAKLAQNEMNVETLATLIDRDTATLYRKINNGVFTTEEVERIKETLSLSDADVISIFFASPVSESETEGGGLN